MSRSPCHPYPGCRLTAALEAVRALIERAEVSQPEGDDPRSLPKIMLTGR